jgi:D-arginine dehydrogenase
MPAADTDPRYDLAIVGAGIAGAAVAYFASAQARVLLLEREAQPGYHSTGRSAAMFMESYGPPQVRALTRASRAFLEHPPAGFADVPLLRRRGVLYVAAPAQADAAEALRATLCADGCPAQALTAAQACARVPVLRAAACAGAVLDPLAADLDVAALHQGFLRGARARGATLVCAAEVSALERDGDGWRIAAGGREWRATAVVNAAGAWADELAARAGLPGVGLQPRRRSAFVFEPPAGLAIADWPCVADVGEGWYFKPDAGLLLGSPANADPVAPHDVVAEEYDVALGIARIEQATTLTIRRPRRTWAGLRSFVADGEPVLGADPAAAGCFWVAALGGYGIQTAAAVGAACAAWIAHRPLPTALRAAGVDAQALRVRRG